MNGIAGQGGWRWIFIIVRLKRAHIIAIGR